MAEENRGNQYDDDLTVGLDNFADESFDAGYVDLFEYAGEEESPISRLKTIMLSIEWEITDEVLINFNDELLSAQQAWADDPVKLVYIQALQKITKYIYQQKADTHHNAMKVLLAFFYNLEKIALDTAISEEEKREILFDDVKTFERLKQQLGLGPGPAEPAAKKDGDEETGEFDSQRDTLESEETNPDLYNLKAYILSIDWEITDKELTEISNEVKTLQNKWATSKFHLLLLQGIDALGGYIKLMKSQSHGDSFKLLNSFYAALEKIVDGDLGYQETKGLLLLETEKFNRFKEAIAASITPEAIIEQRNRSLAEAAAPGESVSADIPEAELDVQDTSEFEQTDVAKDFAEGEGFSEEALEKVTSFFDDLETDEDSAFVSLSSEDALRGVEVETEADDDSDEDALPVLGDGVLAPALAGLEGDSPVIVDESPVSQVSPIPGLDVDTEADDDSDEEALPFAGGELAPALFGDEDSDSAALSAGADESGSGEIDQHIDNFFSDEAFGEAENQDDSASSGPIGDSIAPALSAYGGDKEDAEDDASFSEDLDGRLESFLTEDSSESDDERVDDEKFAALKIRVDELKTELNDTNITSIKAEVDDIKAVLTDRPIERTLAQLISAVLYNIDADGGESNDEAVGLLVSVIDNLEKIRTSAVDQNQALELLSNETEKILQWQQQRLSR